MDDIASSPSKVENVEIEREGIQCFVDHQNQHTLIEAMGIGDDLGEAASVMVDGGGAVSAQLDELEMDETDDVSVFSVIQCTALWFFQNRPRSCTNL